MHHHSDKSILLWEREALLPYLFGKITELSKQERTLQAQPVGMIRIALNDQPNASNGFFLHIWMPKLPVATGGPFAHTHVFDLTSRILKGKIKNIVYLPRSNPNGSHKLTQATCEQDYCAFMQDKILGRVDMDIVEEQTICEGEIYSVPKNIFHETVIEDNEMVVTLMEKSNVDNRSPIIAVPYQVPISSQLFDRNQLNQKIFWKQILALFEDIKLEALSP